MPCLCTLLIFNESLMFPLWGQFLNANFWHKSETLESMIVNRAKIKLPAGFWYWYFAKTDWWLLIILSTIQGTFELYMIYDLIWYKWHTCVKLNLDDCVHCPGHFGVIYLYLHMICDIFCKLYCNCNCVHLSRPPCWLLCPGHPGVIYMIYDIFAISDCWYCVFYPLLPGHLGVGWSLHEGWSECQEEDRAWEWGRDQQIAAAFYILNWSQN